MWFLTLRLRQISRNLKLSLKSVRKSAVVTFTPNLSILFHNNYVRRLKRYHLLEGNIDGMFPKKNSRSIDVEDV